MALPNIFTQEVADQIISRINTLTPDTKSSWGKMTVDQMLAHCNVTYEMVFEDKHPKPNFFMKFILKNLVKDKVVNETPYKHDSTTAPQFLIKERKDFNKEKERLVAYIQKTSDLGAKHFDQLESHSFGPLSSMSWNNMFYKHLNHHLIQFGV